MIVENDDPVGTVYVTGTEVTLTCKISTVAEDQYTLKFLKGLHEQNLAGFCKIKH